MYMKTNFNVQITKIFALASIVELVISFFLLLFFICILSGIAFDKFLIGAI